MSDPQEGEEEQIISRRKFLKGIALGGAAGGVGLALGSRDLAQVGHGATSDVELASYIAYVDSSTNPPTINARNGTTGLVDFTGTSAAAVVQNAINALTSGGKVFLRNGTYVDDTPLRLTNGITLKGEGENTVIQLPNGTNNHVIITDNVNGNSTIAIRDLKIDGKKSGQSGAYPDSDIRGILLANVVRVWIENLFISNVMSHATTVRNALYALQRGMVVDSCGGDGVKLGDAGPGVRRTEHSTI